MLVRLTGRQLLRQVTTAFFKYGRHYGLFPALKQNTRKEGTSVHSTKGAAKAELNSKFQIARRNRLRQRKITANSFRLYDHSNAQIMLPGAVHPTKQCYPQIMQISFSLTFKANFSLVYGPSARTFDFTMAMVSAFGYSYCFQSGIKPTHEWKERHEAFKMNSKIKYIITVLESEERSASKLTSASARIHKEFITGR